MQSLRETSFNLKQMVTRVISNKGVHSHRHQIGCRLLLSTMSFHRIDFFCPAAPSPESISAHFHASLTLENVEGMLPVWKQVNLGSVFPVLGYVARVCWDSRAPRGRGNAIGRGQVRQLVLGSGQHWLMATSLTPTLPYQNKTSSPLPPKANTLTPWSILAPISAQHNWRKRQTECLYDFPHLR